MKGKIMKLRTIFYGLTSGLLLGLSSCSLNYEPLDTYSDVTEGVTSDGTKIVFKDKAAVESHLTTLYNQMRDRQEHWYVDLLLISNITMARNIFASALYCARSAGGNELSVTRSMLQMSLLARAMSSKNGSSHVPTQNWNLQSNYSQTGQLPLR